MTLASEIPVSLSPKERRMIELVADGLRNMDIAEEMGTTSNAVKDYLRVIYDKLGLFNRLELALWALQHEANQV